MADIIVTTSWDDGHVLDMRLAELLRAHDIPATFYVAPDNAELRPQERLGSAQLRDLAEHFEIGGHTLSHARLPRVDIATAAEEIRAGKLRLEDTIDRSVDSFCYPRGEYRHEHVDLVRDAGFSVARTVRRWVSSPPTDLLELGTTVHARRHLKDLGGFARRSVRAPVTGARRFWKWDALAIALFDRTASEGGVFHLWGHSWEIDAWHDWDRLDRVLAHIARRSDVAYLTNGQLAGFGSGAPRQLGIRQGDRA